MIINIEPTIMQEIAEKVVEQAHPGYSKDAQGEWYTVDGQKVVHAQRNRPWDPWSDDADVISVDDLVWYCGGAQNDNADFDPSPADDLIEEYGEEEAGRMGWEAAVNFAFDYVPNSYKTSDLPYE